ncbi:hypothetical protein MRY87_12770 [bacterium]|nr:hypothetical protein [bacterium]
MMQDLSSQRRDRDRYTELQQYIVDEAVEGRDITFGGILRSVRGDPRFPNAGSELRPALKDLYERGVLRPEVEGDEVDIATSTFHYATGL